VAGFWEHGNETSGFINSVVTERLAVSQEGLSPTELVRYEILKSEMCSNRQYEYKQLRIIQGI
jgi:hypothetical protein